MMMRLKSLHRFFILIFIWTALPLTSSGQWWVDTEKAEKARSNGFLLFTSEIKIDATNAINEMYNYNFYDAQREFNYLRAKYPDHPLPDFFLGLIQWWKIIPNIENTLYDVSLLDYMDRTISKADKIWKDTKNPEAAFFLAGAYAVKGRIYSERKNWTKAIFAGNNAIDYLEKCRNYADFSPELMFGDGLYNYYYEFIKENFPLLRPVLWAFPRGKKEEGIKQLEKVSFDAFYTRTEARYFLLSIYAMEGLSNKGYDLAKYTYNQFPNNPYFERMLARTCFFNGKMDECMRLSQDILRKIDEKYTGYEEVSGRYASYFMGYYQFAIYKNYKEAKIYFDQTVNFTEKINDIKSNYYLAALNYLAKIAIQNKDLKSAELYLAKVTKNSDRKNSQNKEAKKLLAEIKKLKKGKSRAN